MRADSFPADLARPVVVGTVPGVRVAVAAVSGLPTRYLDCPAETPSGNSALSASYCFAYASIGSPGPSIHCDIDLE